MFELKLIKQMLSFQKSGIVLIKKILKLINCYFWDVEFCEGTIYTPGKYSWVLCSLYFNYLKQVLFSK